ncbi:alpha-L-fucosidase [Eurytemora carolleeae]|uniref:alpha-L-fucosidase n=1 Tax=Eurytemora carolleeae TaxID=1294199 RepID=UPI000C759232|nr:alpha-L-fucosidase [Eurytemora carolleeae]|eukprot:XP_023344127.1 alpha-L-fucosidase-like [Eurytemora affinis]
MLKTGTKKPVLGTGFTVLLLFVCCCLVESRYQPTWESLDTRPLPSWYDEAKIGVFMHWGPYSVPGVASEWFWFQWKRNDPNNAGDQSVVQYMNKYYPPDFKYQEFGSQLRAEFFNATEWADIVASSGAKYYVLTSKHHDGFSNWPSSRNFGWNSRDIGPKRDVIGELADAFRADGRVEFGLYHSLFEWFNPLYLQVETFSLFYLDWTYRIIIMFSGNYKPQVLWSDGEWEALDTYWRSKEFLAWLYNDSPVKDTVVANDRWGRDILCKHGDFYTCTDRYNPGVLQKHKWENAMTIDRKSWGYRRNMNLEDILTMEELTETLAMTISCGGNLLMNVGPNSQGSIDTIFQERLRQMGDWLKVNGEAVYSSIPWTVQNDTINSKVWYTIRVDKQSGTLVYGILLDWPLDRQVELGSPEPTANTKISILGSNTTISWKAKEGGGLSLELPPRDEISSNWAWVIRLEELGNAGNNVW